MAGHLDRAGSLLNPAPLAAPPDPGRPERYGKLIGNCADPPRERASRSRHGTDNSGRFAIP